MREEKSYKIEVHVAGVCFTNKGALVLKRTDSRKLYPNLWECGGGQIERGESFEEAVKRQLKEEAGVIIEPISIVDQYEIITQDDQKKIPGIYFVCKIIGFVDGKEPQISNEHSEWKWQPLDKLNELEFIPGLEKEIKKAHSVYKTHLP